MLLFLLYCYLLMSNRAGRENHISLSYSIALVLMTTKAGLSMQPLLGLDWTGILDNHISSPKVVLS